ncbi:hypothetical protein RB195_003355 [Necator americanus]|uniref:Uncharacterized protein n=1 Tax=Necator americanus TaxID=51031 RepID=A0ABR1DNY0_NECAM
MVCERNDIGGDRRTGERRRRQPHHREEKLREETESSTAMRMSAGADERTVSQLIGVNLPPIVDEKLTETYRKIVDMSPLPTHFDFGHMFESYVWRAVFLTSFTIGIRLGNIDAISFLFVGIFGVTITFILTYIVLPVGTIYGNQNLKKDFSIHERRIVLIGISALLGILSSAINQHYVIKDTAAPSYFLPGLVGLAVQVVGPKFAHDRAQFLAVTVGSAFTTGVVLMAIFHDLSFAALVGLLISAICATINLQVMVHTIIQGGIDMMGGHVTAVVMALYQHLVFSRLFGEYSEEEYSTPSVTKPILYS